VQDIKEHGVRNPVLIDKTTSTLITGQSRVLASKKLGLSTIPAWLIDCVPGSPESKLIAIENDFERMRTANHTVDAAGRGSLKG
jgi:hypothetical protein